MSIERKRMEEEEEVSTYVGSMRERERERKKCVEQVPTQANNMTDKSEPIEKNRRQSAIKQQTSKSIINYSLRR